MYLVVGYRTLKHAVNEKARRELSIVGSTTAIDPRISVRWGAAAVVQRIGQFRVSERDRDFSPFQLPIAVWLRRRSCGTQCSGYNTIRPPDHCDKGTS